MDGIVEVKMGGLEVVTGGTGLKTFVGSCVALCLFDVSSKVAAMAHIMLPKKPGNKQDIVNDEKGKFADVAFATMLHDMTQKGADLKKIQAKIAGGATIFSHESETGLFNIGPRNIETIKQILRESNIPLVGEDTGKNFGRWVRFDLNSGEMTTISNLKKTQTVL